MTKTELQDNLVFLSALKLLEQLTEKGLLTVDEAEKSRIELERKLRQVDQHRARHHAMLSDLPWGSQEGYHLCVNTTGLSLKTLAPLVAEYARSWFSHQGTP